MIWSPAGYICYFLWQYACALWHIATLGYEWVVGCFLGLQQIHPNLVNRVLKYLVPHPSIATWPRRWTKAEYTVNRRSNHRKPRKKKLSSFSKSQNQSQWYRASCHTTLYNSFRAILSACKNCIKISLKLSFHQTFNMISDCLHRLIPLEVDFFFKYLIFVFSIHVFRHLVFKTKFLFRF